MGDILGADFLTNPKMIGENVDFKMPDIGSIDLPELTSEAPKLMPTLESVGQFQTFGRHIRQM